MKKVILCLSTLLLACTPITQSHAWNWNFSLNIDLKNSKILPIVGAGLATVGVIGLATWLLSESDYDVIRNAQSDLETAYHNFSDILRVYDQYPYNEYVKDEHFKALIGQQYGHEKFYLLTCRKTISRHCSTLRNQVNKIQQRLAKVDAKLTSLSRYDEKYPIAKSVRKQLLTLRNNLHHLIPLLDDLYKRIGTWPEFAYQQKKHKKLLQKREQERRERERERKLREQQWELDRLNNRLRQLEREKHARNYCSDYPQTGSIHVSVGL